MSNSLQRHQAEEYTDDIRALCDGTSEKFNLPKLDEPCILEGTITNKNMQSFGVSSVSVAVSADESSLRADVNEPKNGEYSEIKKTK